MKRQEFIPLLVVAAGRFAYHNSFTGSFFHDEEAMRLKPGDADAENKLAQLRTVQ